MPALPDLRPLILNLLGRYVIQSHLLGQQGGPPQGQRSDVQQWSQVLEELCSSVSAPSKLSHTTMQFVRYVSLLEHIQQLKEGELNQESLMEIVKLLSNLCNSPELQDPSLQVKLTPLLVDAMSGLTSNNMVHEYTKKVMDFVTEAMEVYTVVPNISLGGEAFGERGAVSPTRHKATSTSAAATSATTTVLPLTTNTAVPHTTSTPPTTNIAVAPATTITVPPITTATPKDLPRGARKRRKLNTPVKTKQVNTQSPLVENREIKPDVTVKLDFDPPLPPQSSNTLSLKANIDSNPSVTVATAVAGSSSVVGDGYGVIITYPPIIPTENQGVMEPPKLKGAAKRGIFDRGIESGTEMEWSSDESTSISPTKGSKEMSSTGEVSHTVMLSDSFIKKGVWSEEESRCLLEGVEKFGEGKWKEIRAEAYSVLKHRTTNQLKDKYRNIKGRSKTY